MSTETEEDFIKRLKTLDVIVKLGWGLIAGAFVIGVWVATIQIRMIDQADQLAASEIRLRKLELNDAANDERLKNILTIVDRIDRRLP